MGGRVGGWVGVVEIQSKLLVWDTMDQDEERGVEARRRGGQDDPPGTFRVPSSLSLPTAVPVSVLDPGIPSDIGKR